MGWDHQERQRQLAPVGVYQAKVYRVTGHATFEQVRLQTAALTILNRTDVSAFFLFAARYVLRHHRDAEAAPGHLQEGRAGDSCRSPSARRTGVQRA